MQRNLKLGGNTDKEVRPELIVYQLGAFCRTGNGRFAFCGHVRKDQEKVEAIVNEAIRKKTDVILEVMPLRKAHAKYRGTCLFQNQEGRGVQRRCQTDQSRT